MIKYLTLSILCLFIACGATKPVPQAPEASTQILDSRIQGILPYLPYCQYSPEFKGISKDTCTAEVTGEGDGDILLFAGLLCASGEALGCETAKRSIDVEGRLWRSPGRVGRDVYPTSSRDMLLGALLYVAATRDTDAANRILAYIESNNDRVCFDRCDLTPAFWGNFYVVWKYLGLKTTSKMDKGAYLDEIGQGVSAIFNQDYSLHLVGVTLYLREITHSTNWVTKLIAKQLLAKQGDNPFFRYLVEGKSQGTIDLAIRLFPQAPFTYRNEWTFERNLDDLQPVQNSMLWEFVFIGRLLAQN